MATTPNQAYGDVHRPQCPPHCPAIPANQHRHLAQAHCPPAPRPQGQRSVSSAGLNGLQRAA